MKREAAWQRIESQQSPWDLLIIGGGATGLGIAVDAATRGLSTVLVEAVDFAKGTSSRSTKLVHGGVRYLKQGNIRLVRDALRERRLLLQNAPHLVRDLSFVIPCSGLWERLLYGIGLTLYDALAGRDVFGKSHVMGTKQARQQLSCLIQTKVRGGVLYHDGQFDDARLAIHLAMTAHRHGACLLNHAPVVGFVKDACGQICGAEIVDVETEKRCSLHAKVVVNATGPFCDSLRRLDNDQQAPLVSASQGIHIVLPRRFYPHDTAMIVPKTSDGRVLFLIPWHDVVVVGTTDTPISEVPWEPKPTQSELEFILETLAHYLQVTPQRSDILSMFAGVRPLVRGDGTGDASVKSQVTAKLSRDHQIHWDGSGLLTITGGKWTTYRKMAEDCVNEVQKKLPGKERPCVTHQLPIDGLTKEPARKPARQSNSIDLCYGRDIVALQALEAERPELSCHFSPRLPLRRSHVVFAVESEMARTVEDVLARRSRALFLDAQEALSIAPEVARLMASLLKRDEQWIEHQLNQFAETARGFQPLQSPDPQH